MEVQTSRRKNETDIPKLTGNIWKFSIKQKLHLFTYKLDLSKKNRGWRLDFKILSKPSKLKLKLTESLKNIIS